MNVMVIFGQLIPFHSAHLTFNTDSKNIIHISILNFTQYTVLTQNHVLSSFIEAEIFNLTKS